MSLQANPASDAWYRSVEKTSQTDDERIKDITVLPPPEHLIRFFPISNTPVEGLISQTRKNIHNIMAGDDDRLLVIIGPCSIHDPAAALDYARRLKVVREQYKDTLEIVMRVYFEKPRTTVGWKGLINDPYLDETYRIDEGLRIARQLLIDINRLGMPAGSEFLDVISPQYIGDLIAWGAIGARTTESQVHRELASGLSAPIGFKNGTDGNIRIATDAIQSASRGHHFLSVHKNGQVAIVNTAMNSYRLDSGQRWSFEYCEPCDPPPEASHITPEGKQTAEGALPQPGDVVRLVRVPTNDEYPHDSGRWEPNWGGIGDYMRVHYVGSNINGTRVVRAVFGLEWPLSCVEVVKGGDK